MQTSTSSSNFVPAFLGFVKTLTLHYIKILILCKPFLHDIKGNVSLSDGQCTYNSKNITIFLNIRILLGQILLYTLIQKVIYKISCNYNNTITNITVLGSLGTLIPEFSDCICSRLRTCELDNLNRLLYRLYAHVTLFISYQKHKYVHI